MLTLSNETFFAGKLKRAGKAADVERNEIMIDMSDICMFYCENPYDTKLSKDKVSINASHSGGTARAYKYAVLRGKEIINTYE